MEKIGEWEREESEELERKENRKKRQERGRNYEGMGTGGEDTEGGKRVRERGEDGEGDHRYERR